MAEICHQYLQKTEANIEGKKVNWYCGASDM